MEPPPANSSDTDPVKIVAAIDVGANALRMVIAEVYADGRIEVLERLHRAVRLGQDTFRRGRLGGQSMRTAIGVLRDFRRLLDLYKVEKVRAVATSAVREASNGETFLDRVFMATHLNIEVIDPSEESRLTVSAVRQALGNSLGADHLHTLIADVGGGSTLLTIIEGGEIINSQSLRLGSIRLQETLSTSEESPRRIGRLGPPARFQHAGGAGKRGAAGRDRFVCRRRGRCAVCRPRNRRRRPGNRRAGGDRSGRLR